MSENNITLIVAVMCPECRGKKEVLCICQCGNEHETQCLKCDGDGSIVIKTSKINEKSEENQ